MKIGVLTYFNIPNHGANIQALCTNAYLNHLGHDVWFFDYVNNDIDNRFYNSADHAQYYLHKEFASKYFQLTKKCFSERDLLQEVKRIGIEYVYVGSDAVFNLGPGHTSYPNPFWLDWCKAQNTPCSAMSASSMGYLFFKERKKLLQIRKSLQTFDKISVRDYWTQFFITLIGGRKIKLSYDPTCMVDYLDSYLNEINFPEFLINKSYIIVSLSKASVNKDWLASLKLEANRNKYIICVVPHPDASFTDFPADYIFNEALAPLQWLKIIKFSSGYIGERFHPVLISLYYGKPIISIDTYAHNFTTKFSLLKFRSKTFDVMFRARLSKYYFSLDKFKTYLSPLTAFHLIKTYCPKRAILFKNKSIKSFQYFLQGR